MSEWEGPLGAECFSESESQAGWRCLVGRKGESDGKGDCTWTPCCQRYSLRALSSNRVISGGRAHLLFSEWGFFLSHLSFSGSPACCLSTYKCAFTTWKDILLHIIMDSLGDFHSTHFSLFEKFHKDPNYFFYNQKSYTYSHWKNKHLKIRKNVQILKVSLY